MHTMSPCGNLLDHGTEVVGATMGEHACCLGHVGEGVGTAR